MVKNYEKYSLNINFNQLGGSYIINSEQNMLGADPKIISYPEVTFKLEEHIGSGGSGSVSRAIIINCSINPSLNGKVVAIKFFNSSNGFTAESKKQYEKDKMISYHLDADGSILKINNAAILYFDIRSGTKLKNTLVYEYGGETLNKYKDSSYHNEINNKRILIQLFTILRLLTNEKNNMHNDLKCENIVYLIDGNGLINIQLIDFGASFGIEELRTGTGTLIRRTNMNSPEAIKNFLVNNHQIYPYQGIERVDERNFSKWYYYPFLSILFFIYTGKEYSTGESTLINEIINMVNPGFTTIFQNKIDIISRLLNNDFIKYYFYHRSYNKYINKDLNILSTEFAPKYTIIQNLIDNMCKPIINKRLNEDEVLAELNKL
jgi:hypothetical protein